MSKIKNIIAGLGIVASLGVVAAPLAVYADDPNHNPNTVTAVINPVISMRLVSTDSSSTSDPDETECQSQRTPACTGDTQSVHTTIMPSADDTSSMYTDIYVSTNSTAGYNLTLADADGNTSLQTPAGDTIATISSLPVGGSNPGWAVRIDGANTWYAMPTSTSNTPITVKSFTPSPAAVVVEDHSKVYYGVAASSTQASGTYSDTITYTATAVI